MKLAKRDLDSQKNDLQEKLSTIREGFNKVYGGIEHAGENVHLLKKFALNSDSQDQTAALFYSSLSILESYIGALRDDLNAIDEHLLCAEQEVHHA